MAVVSVCVCSEEGPSLFPGQGQEDRTRESGEVGRRASWDQQHIQMQAWQAAGGAGQQAWERPITALFPGLLGTCPPEDTHPDGSPSGVFNDSCLPRLQF